MKTCFSIFIVSCGITTYIQPYSVVALSGQYFSHNMAQIINYICFIWRIFIKLFSFIYNVF